MNVKYHSSYKKYNAKVPLYLHNRPRSFVAHCLSRKEDGEVIPYSKITEKDYTQGKFSIRANDGHNHYTVDFGVIIGLPSCNCPDFVLNGLPCKHFSSLNTTGTGNDCQRATEKTFFLFLTSKMTN